MGSEPSHPVSDPEHTLDQIAERSKGLLRCYGISHEIERPGEWRCYRQSSLAIDQPSLYPVYNPSLQSRAT
jgi:hypothetical protein